MATFVKFSIRKQDILINPEQVISIEYGGNFATIHCVDGVTYSVSIGSGTGNDMTKSEFDDRISLLTNIYTINESNSSVG